MVQYFFFFVFPKGKQPAKYNRLDIAGTLLSLLMYSQRLWHHLLQAWRVMAGNGGELHVPLEVCGAVVKRELDFWQIDEMEIKACCWRHYRSYIENQAILDSFNNSLLHENVHVDLDALKGWRRLQWRIWLILEYPRTSRMAMKINAAVTDFRANLSSLDTAAEL
ncbi:hypothetical protein C0Q70_16035 [Pomacea canaliculata]|uniref:Uncharacterized protein n=1 Tax=Pomacea canaliculata TaxID=400727 RepID=A0A2T7NNM9_POMCA|nr:hypothetical protein C0Q70_16035 [Pomacea canaliculata]